MPEPASAYRPLAGHLPAVYQEDADSWEQVTEYLGLVDDVLRGLIVELDEAGTWLSPEFRAVSVPGLAPGAAPDEIVTRSFALVNQLADWFAFDFPDSWHVAGDPDAELDRKRTFLLRAARLWRRRGTPNGFYAWLVFWFALAPPLPIMIEHFKYRTDDPGAAATDPDDNAHMVTLLTPLDAFTDYRRRRELSEFVARHEPAHLIVRVCWISSADARYTGFSPTNRPAVRTLLRTIATYTAEADGIHLEHAPPSSSPLNRLGQGNLPGPAHM
jgi:hypothetical protein